MTDHDRRAITVLGHGRAETAPDQAEVVLGVEVVRPTAGEARAEAAAVMDRVFAALRDAGIAADDVRTSDLSLGAEIEYRPDGPPRRLGFRLANRVTVRVAPDGVSGVVDRAVAAGATSLDGVSFRVRDETTARLAALGSAMEDARAAAEAIASAAGVRLGAVRSVREAPEGGMVPVARLAVMEMKAADTPIAPGLSRIEAALEVSWELEP
jgi:uncharacterized protein YggE